MSGVGWTPTARVTRASQSTWNSLAALGFVNARRRAADGERY